MEKTVDYKLFFAILSLIIFWMIMISSVSVYSSFLLTIKQYTSWLIQEPYNYFYVIRNIYHVLISLLILWLISKIPYVFFQKRIKQFSLLIIFLLVYVIIRWTVYWWASWWIIIPFLPSIQPTEFLKFFFILFLAYFFKINNQSLSDFKTGFLPFLWILLIVVILVALQPDFGTLMVLLPVSFIMFYIASNNIKHLLISIALAFLLVIWVYFAWDYDKKTLKNNNTFWYVTQRIDNFLSDKKKAIASRTINYQTEQGLIAIWSWWFWWLGFWKSIQKFGYLPEVQGDFIYSVIIEELWLISSIILVSVYLYIWYRWFYIASRVDDLFAKYSAIWISSWILVQAFINIWVNLNIVPLTWITLPFISYWWSSLLALSLAVWFLLNVSRHMKEEKIYSRLYKNA